MLQGKQGEFYDEVMRALWGYMSYKLNMPVEQLSRENIREKLFAHDVDDATIQKFTSALDECEFERYAPGDPAGNMNRTFESAMTAIMEIENAINATRKNARSILPDIPSYGCSWRCWASALLRYRQSPRTMPIRNTRRATTSRLSATTKSCSKNGASAEIYYNLGNAYYRTDNITKAVLNYERARLPRLEMRTSTSISSLHAARLSTRLPR